MKSYAPGTVTSTILPDSLIKQISDGMIFSTFWFNEKLVFFCKSLDEDDKAYSFLFFCDGGLRYKSEEWDRLMYFMHYGKVEKWCQK